MPQLTAIDANSVRLKGKGEQATWKSMWLRLFMANKFEFSLSIAVILYNVSGLS